MSSATTGPDSLTWAEEWSRIQELAAMHNVDPLFMAAIRKAENGRSGREFGILSVNAPTYHEQCSVACKTIRNRLSRYARNPLGLAKSYEGVSRIVYNYEFIVWLSKIWAPVGVANDPTNLNRHWPRNVQKWYLRFLEGGPKEGE